MRLSSYARSALVVFSGAFLLFAIQPIAGKQLLPHFGGSSSVWATSLLFFTSVLFLGYLYVYAITRLSPRAQSSVHLGLLVSAGFFVVAFFALSGVGVFARWPSGMPALEVLFALTISIGVPYFLLSTTVPLIQYWYGTLSGKEPYSLYALSNTASLLALLSYPFVIEPLIALSDQRFAWAALFMLYALLCAASARAYARARDREEASRAAGKKHKVLTIVLWTLLAALPSFTLVAITTQITQIIAPVPLLWVVPLALYLVTFVIAFRGWAQSVFTPLLFLGAAALAWRFMRAPDEYVVLQIASSLALLFFCGLACHVLLYKMRPATPSSPLFYVFLSLGGALGVLLASIVAPIAFTDYWEFPLAIALSSALAIWILPLSFFPRIVSARHAFIVKLLTMLVVALFFIGLFWENGGSPSVTSRNFYGIATVRFDDGLISLLHGGTLHGTQFSSRQNEFLPTTYYSPGSGVGRAIHYARSTRGDEGVQIGVLGLGTGSIAAHCVPADTFVFYEIDPHIESIARSYFSYIAHCDGAEIRLGDGRLVLEEELEQGAPGMYDVLAMDAFNDDTVPVHLLTVEAFRLYAAHLVPGGMIAVHISNRYLDLRPVVFRAAAELGFAAMLVVDSGESTPGGSSSSWVILTKDANVFRSLAFANTHSYPSQPAKRAWTDDYSSLFSVLDLAKPWE